MSCTSSKPPSSVPMPPPCRPRYYGRSWRIPSPTRDLSCSWPTGRRPVSTSSEGAVGRSGPLGELCFRDHALEDLGRALDAIKQVPAISRQHPHDGAFAASGRKTHPPRSKLDGGTHLELMA